MKSNTQNQKLLVEQDFLDAAAELGCSLAAIKAVAEVESKGNGFLPDGKPIILYEPHIFSRHSQRRFDKTNPDLSYPVWKPGKYGKVSEQWGKLQRAIRLDETAALKACSWGRFQVCGFNHLLCGYPTVGEFVAAMIADETNHLAAFVAYVKATSLDDELRRLDWVNFAAGYNGKYHFRNDYAGKMARAYKRFGGK